jgi:multicomponent Na+:H+ antiporter subunit E
MALGWMVLTGGSRDNWTLAAIVVVAAAYVSLLSVPVGSFRLTAGGILRFLRYFLLYSARAGVDVAIRAFRRPDVPDAGTFNYTTTLPEGITRRFFVASIALFPGSLGVDLDGDRVRAHVLDRSAEVEAQFRALERRVADLFGGE